VGGPTPVRERPHHWGVEGPTPVCRRPHAGV
jgi:hypothetical protein